MAEDNNDLISPSKELGILNERKKEGVEEGKILEKMRIFTFHPLGMSYPAKFKSTNASLKNQTKLNQTNPNFRLSRVWEGYDVRSLTRISKRDAETVSDIEPRLM